MADFDASDAVAARVQAALEDEGASELRARSWRELMPQVAQMVESTSGTIWIFYLVIYLLAALGILNTQRMSALERRREFGVLLAIGVSPGRLGATICFEAALLTVFGGLLGLLLGLAFVGYHATAGLNMGYFSSDGEGFSYMGVAFDERLYFVVDAWSLLEPVIAVAIVGVLCGLWPAISAARLHPVRAISGRT